MSNLQPSFFVKPEGYGYAVTGKPTYEELEQKVRELENQIRESRVAQWELQETKEQLNAVLDTIQAGIVVIDAKTRTIVGANAAAGRMIGTPEHKLLNQPCHGLICRHAQGDCPVLDRGLSLTNYEQRLATARGGEIPILMTAVSIMLVGREHVLESFVDITERRRAEQEREVLIGQLQDALAQVKLLSGMLPICASCKKIRNDKGYWNQIETYIRDHAKAEFSHSICPDCAKELDPGFRFGKS